MNVASIWTMPSRLLFRTARKFRRLLPGKKSQAFGPPCGAKCPRIERVYVINLDRQPGRWSEIERELKQVLDHSGKDLRNLTERFAAVDANHFIQEPKKDASVDPVYSLRDQLFVEPQPMVMPDRFQLDSPIQMSRQEVAVAHSHINVWKRVAANDQEYALVLEDDVWFRPNFARELDQAWSQLEALRGGATSFDILYLSYEEAKHGAPKTFISTNVFRPDRGLWQLSGYVISRKGAKALLGHLPCRGPVDLWLNHQFGVLDVYATRRSIISQRRDFSSTNSYSILPALTKIGAITSEGASLFHVRPSEGPVFGFGPPGSGLSSLAMALSMLGYRCCSDLQAIPDSEKESLLMGRRDRLFNAFVNINSLEREITALRRLYPRAKFIITTDIADDSLSTLLDALDGADIAFLPSTTSNKWQVVCEHLRSAPPASSFPELVDLGQRATIREEKQAKSTPPCKTSKRDTSPWIIGPSKRWQGIHAAPAEVRRVNPSIPVNIYDAFEFLDTGRWLLRDDTFTGNLGLFRPSNVEFRAGFGAALTIKRESLGVREYSAASLTSIDEYLFGRFEAIIKASDVPGVITGFFLYRNSPRQEIDIEIAGNRPHCLLVNVFYNPGGDGAKFDYGYRGSPSYIELGFDASQSFHRFAIEWGPCAIRWFVDDQLVHTRVEWKPTPIPHLPMTLHMNTWPCRSTELAGRIAGRQLPTTTCVKSIELRANRYERLPAL